MRVVPEGPGLGRRRERVKERVAGDDWALVDTGRAICPCASSLEKTVPMLPRVMRNRTRKL